MGDTPDDGVQVDCDHLRDDATRWAGGAQALHTAGAAIRRIQLTPADFGPIADAGADVAFHAYAGLQQKTVAMLDGGTQELTGLSGVLRNAADTFQAEDQHGKRTLNQVDDESDVESDDEEGPG